MIHDRTRLLIRTEGLSKLCRSGNGHEEAISGLNLSIKQGEFVIIRGISGIHKTAFFKLLGCLERPDSGKYYFDYEDIALAADEALEDIRRNKIGYLFRDFRLIERLNVTRNVEVPMYGMNITPVQKADRISAAINTAGIGDIVSEQAGGLSDYQKQLAAFARAIVNMPLMILADEPQANLSLEEAGFFMAKLLRLNAEGVAILLFTAGNITGLQGVNRVITFEKGRLISDIKVETHCCNGGAV